MESECVHMLKVFRKPDDIPRCTECGKIEKREEFIKCAHCEKFTHFSDWYSEDGEWIQFENGDWDLIDHCIYTCSECNKISIDPEVKIIITWI